MPPESSFTSPRFSASMAIVPDPASAHAIAESDRSVPGG